MASPVDPNDHPPSPQGQSPEGFSSFSFTTQIIHTNELIIDEKGDIILVLNDATARVSADVLSRSSPVFKALLGPNFSEGQQPRSTEKPKHIELLHDHSLSITRLCLVLHRPLEEVRGTIYTGESTGAAAANIAGLAIVADKYGAVEHLKKDIAPALLKSFMKRKKRTQLEFMQTANLALAAYLFEQAEAFSLFTRCLIMDQSKMLSMLMYQDIFDHIPTAAFLILEEQRIAVRWRIESTINFYALIPCGYCDTTRYDQGFPSAVAQKLNPKSEHWPPDLKKHNLRNVLSALSAIGSYTAFDGEEDTLCSEHQYVSCFGNGCFRKTAEAVNLFAYGLCYACTRSGKHPTECEHEVALRKRAGELDPIS